MFHVHGKDDVDTAGNKHWLGTAGFPTVQETMFETNVELMFEDNAQKNVSVPAPMLEGLHL